MSRIVTADGDGPHRQPAALPKPAEEDTFRLLVERSIQGILVHQNQKPLFVNEAWAQAHGATVEDVLKMDSVLPLIHPDEHERMLGYMRARMRGEPAPESYEYRGLR